MRLSVAEFFEFAVQLPEAGDLDGMKALLARHAGSEANRERLLHGGRKAKDGYVYSAWGYSVWLSGLGGTWRARARPVVDWLVEQGCEPDFWLAVADEDLDAVRGFVAADPTLLEARHPVFGLPLLESVEGPAHDLLEELGASAA